MADLECQGFGHICCIAVQNDPEICRRPKQGKRRKYALVAKA